jgi:hypothetical protein
LTFYQTDATVPNLTVFEFCDLQVIGGQNSPGGVIYAGSGNLLTDLGLQEIRLRLGQPGLRIEHKENGLRSEFVFALLRSQGLLGQIQHGFARGQCELRFS